MTISYPSSTSTATDTFGDTCDWYTSNTELCGEYDDGDFTASELCAACGAPATCVDGDGTDAAGDGCWWYDSNPETCGDYDSDTFSASLTCCACQGYFVLNLAASSAPTKTRLPVLNL